MAALLLTMLMAGCQKEDEIIPIPTDIDTVPVPATFAYLVDGPTFREAIPEGATAALFVYDDTTVSQGTLLSIPASPYPVYGNLVDSVWRISTPADMIYTNPDCQKMFAVVPAHPHRIRQIDFGSGFNTSLTTNMSQCFYCCADLTSLDLSCFNTANVTEMRWMFSRCVYLTSLNLSSFNTAQVKDMEMMFYGCRHLNHLDLSSFNTARAEDMSFMFCGCEQLERLDVSSFNTAEVEDMTAMFTGCFQLTSLNLSSFNTAKVTSLWRMFEYCERLTELNLYGFDFSSCRHKTDMCNDLATVSEACTITCSAATQAELQEGTSLPTSGVSFTWNVHE